MRSIISKKFLSTSLLVSLVITVAWNFASPAHAVISAKPMVQIGAVDSAAIGLVLSGNQVLAYGNREKSGFAQLINGEIIELNCGVESFVSAATTDLNGNFYLVGASSNPIVGTLPPIAGVLNPDNVMPDPVSNNKSDATSLCLWKLDPTGKLIENTTMNMASVVFPSALLADKFGITIAGASYANPGFKSFVTDWNGAPTFIGKSATQILSISRGADGSIVAVGQSSEKLLDRPLRGKADGFLARVSKGKVVLVQRSSDINANRAWLTSTSNLLLGGYSNSTAVITKFSNNFLPTWTDRFPSKGGALTANLGKTNYGVFYSTGPVRALPTWNNWKRKGAILLLTFDSKGTITGASYILSQKLNGLAANSTLGPLILASGFIYRV